MALKIIGLGHQKFVGKDTCFNYFSKYINQFDRERDTRYYVGRVGFADVLKDVCKLMYPSMLQRWQYDEQPSRKNDLVPGLMLTVRDIWIQVGNKMREIDENVWIRAAIGQAREKGYSHAIITDVRYPNEADILKNEGALLFKVVNNRVAHTNDVADNALMAFTQWDEVIENHGSKQELEEICKNLVQKHKDYLML